MPTLNLNRKESSLSQTKLKLTVQQSSSPRGGQNNVSFKIDDQITVSPRNLGGGSSTTRSQKIRFVPQLLQYLMNDNINDSDEIRKQEEQEKESTR